MIIKFNKNIYKKKAIVKAGKEYKHLADFDIKNQNKYYQVVFSKIDKDVKEIIEDEFKNYVLYLMDLN